MLAGETAGERERERARARAREGGWERVREGGTESLQWTASRWARWVRRDHSKPGAVGLERPVLGAREWLRDVETST